MSHYVDGFVLPIGKDQLAAYRELAAVAADIWKEHGALEYRECLGDDLHIPGMVSFHQLAGCGPEETVVFAWAVFASKAARDAANAKIHEDPRLKAACDPTKAPFDCARLAYGGFTTLVQA